MRSGSRLRGPGLTIGKGRLYVDGLLAENHGAVSGDDASRRFDPLLGEPFFADPILYAAQPYLPEPPPLPTAGRHLVYLDVWDRERSYLDEPGLVESAVGVETSARVQTVWQVRTLGEDAGNAGCASPDADLPGWADMIAPSTGVLSTGTYEVAPVDDPCVLPPTGGYRGLENQLYRVEIHDGGAPGTATFKWSRENAAVGARVTAMVAGGELELATLGRDDVLSIKTGDWIEIIDDRSELAQAPGQLRKVTVDAATRRITFAPALPAAMLPGSFPDFAFADAHSLRVCRWDQHGKVFRLGSAGTPVQAADLDAAGSTGAIVVPAAATTFLLENGVTVRFDVTGPKGFRSGDFWVFAARTADASVELLDHAPPRGLHHHYARLALWDVGAGTVTDCRQPWPPATGEGHDCACTACVTAASHASGQFTIQDAVNQVAQTGGTVCLGVGQYALAAPVQVVGARAVRIAGQGAATLIATAGTAFALRNGVAIGIERLAILSLGRQPAIAVDTAIGLTLRQLVIAVLETNDGRAAAIALSGVVAFAVIEQNGILASTGILANDPTAPVQAPPGANVSPPFLLAASLRIRDNALWCRRQGIVLDGRVIHLLETQLDGNDGIGCSVVGISALGAGLPGATVAIDRNTLSLTGAGIRCALRSAAITGNVVVSTATGDAARTAGIALPPGLDRGGIDLAQLLANQVSGFGLAGIVIGTPVRDLLVKQNVVSRCGNGILSTGEAISIENNHLRDIGAANARDAAGGLVIGIGVVRAGAATVAGNTLRNIGTTQVQAAARAGILLVATDKVRVTGNDMVGVGPGGDFVGPAFGVAALAPMTGFAIAGNRIDREADAPDQPGAGEWIGLALRELPPVGQWTRTGTTSIVRVDAARTLVLDAGRAYLSTGAVSPAGAVAITGATGTVLGNTIDARGDAPAVEIAARECQFNDNRVDARFNRRAAVRIAAGIVTFASNRVTGDELSVQITGATEKTAAIVGNITRRGIALSGGPVPAPWNALNLIA